MTNELINRQILSLAQQGAGAGEISETLGVEQAQVKLVLSAHNAGSAEDRDISDEQLKLLRDRAYILAMQNEDLKVSARMTQYLIDRDKPKGVQPVSPLVQINQALIAANESFAKLVDTYK